METQSPQHLERHKPKIGMWRRLALILAAFSLLAAACGSDDDDESADAMAATDEGGDMLGAFGPGCAAVPTDGDGSFAGMADDPAGTAAANNPVLSTLVSAAVEAGLVDTLNSEGPFTIFAPTDDAFAAIDTEILDAVLADQDLLTSVLTYHVISGESLDAESLGETGTAATVEGGELSFGSDGTTVNDVDAICSDVPVANGTVHIIDEVLLPQVAVAAIGALTGDDAMEDDDTMEDDDAMEDDTMEDDDAMEDDTMEDDTMEDVTMEDDAMEDDAMEDAMLGATGSACASVPTDGEGSFAGMADDPAGTAAAANPLLSTLVGAVVEADLVDTLNSDGPFTIFAPSNDAFAAVPSDDLDAVLADKDLLTSVLTYHVIAGEKLSSDDLIAAGSATTVNGADLSFSAAGGAVSINGSANTVCMNVPTANAVVHIIDGVLLP